MLPACTHCGRCSINVFCLIGNLKSGLSWRFLFIFALKCSFVIIGVTQVWIKLVRIFGRDWSLFQRFYRFRLILGIEKVCSLIAHSFRVPWLTYAILFVTLVGVFLAHTRQCWSHSDMLLAHLMIAILILLSHFGLMLTFYLTLITLPFLAICCRLLANHQDLFFLLSWLRWSTNLIIWAIIYRCWIYQ